MRPRWRKVISDLIDNKVRTILVVLSIAVGVFAIGVLAGTYVIISDDLGVTYAANNPSNLEIRLDDFDQDLLHTAHIHCRLQLCTAIKAVSHKHNNFSRLSGTLGLLAHTIVIEPISLWPLCIALDFIQ